MEFFDCNVSYGYNVRDKMINPINNISELNGAMNSAGVKKAMVSRIEQITAGTITANNMLVDDILEYQNMYGVWSLIPPHTHEMPEGELMLHAMKEKRIFGWRLIPNIARYMIKGFVLKNYLVIAINRKIPIFINTDHSDGLEPISDMLMQFPETITVITHAHIWPNDRLLRPLVAEYPNVYLDMSFFITEGGVESFVEEYGADRLLYGSGFPYCYFGSNMLMIKHASISKSDKEAIAGGNMTKIIEGVLL